MYGWAREICENVNALQLSEHFLYFRMPPIHIWFVFALFYYVFHDVCVCVIGKTNYQLIACREMPHEK